mgnify:CR=1 FL=1
MKQKILAAVCALALCAALVPAGLLLAAALVMCREEEERP